MGKHGSGGGDDWRSGFAGRIEVRESATGRRERPEAVKGRIVRESLEHGASVKDVAHRHGIAPQQLTTWRRAARQGRLALPEDPVAEDGFPKFDKIGCDLVRLRSPGGVRSRI